MKMSNEVLLSNVIAFAGSGLVGYAIGFAPLGCEVNAVSFDSLVCSGSGI
jgi:hypothetical protein